MAKKAIFRLFSIFSKTVHTIRTKFLVILHQIMVLCVQFHQIRMTGIRASQKEKDLSRLLYRICGSGLILETSSQQSVKMRAMLCNIV